MNPLAMRIGLLVGATLFVGGVGAIIFATRSTPARTVTVAARPSANEKPSAGIAEIEALRGEVQSLRQLVASRDGLAPAPQASAIPPARADARVADVPEPGDDIVGILQTATFDRGKTLAVEKSLQERFSSEAFAQAAVHVEEVDCRGKACRLGVSFADTAQIEPILLELVGSLPNSQGFQQVTTAGDGRKKLTSYQLERLSGPLESASERKAVPRAVPLPATAAPRY